MALPAHALSTEFTVRSYEVDSYAHLNNGVYISWFEQGRLLWLKSKGFSYDGFAERREWFVVAHTAVDFRRPLGEGERIVLATAIEALGRSSVRWRQVMQLGAEEDTDSEGSPDVARQPLARSANTSKQAAPRNPTVVAEARTVMVFSGGGGRAIPIPADFRAVASGTAVTR